MTLDQIKAIDWKQNPALHAVQQKLEGLVERESKSLARLEELQRTIHEGETALVQALACGLLGEPSKESAESIQLRLESAQRETIDLRSNTAALTLAMARLEQDVKAATSEAKLRVAAQLLPTYAETARALRVQLEKAAALNRILHAIHSVTVQRDLVREFHRNPVLKPLGSLASWNYLTTHNGNLSQEFEYWIRYTDNIFGTN